MHMCDVHSATLFIAWHVYVWGRFQYYFSYLLVRKMRRRIKMQMKWCGMKKKRLVQFFPKTPNLIFIFYTYYYWPTGSYTDHIALAVRIYRFY